MGCNDFACGDTGSVNGEALLVASGQNLKRLLQKRGWERRPFPAQAVALMPPQMQEAERESRTRFVQRQQRQSASIAATSLASWTTIKIQMGLRSVCFLW